MIIRSLIILLQHPSSMYFIYIIQSFPSSIHPNCSFSSVYHSFYSQHPLTTLIPARYIIQPSTIHPFTAFSQLHLAPFIHAIAIHPSTILLTAFSLFLLYSSQLQLLIRLPFILLAYSIQSFHYYFQSILQLFIRLLFILLTVFSLFLPASPINPEVKAFIETVTILVATYTLSLYNICQPLS